MYTQFYSSDVCKTVRAAVELIHLSRGSSTYSALTRMGSKLKTDTVLTDETSEIEPDLCAFGPIGG